MILILLLVILVLEVYPFFVLLNHFPESSQLLFTLIYVTASLLSYIGMGYYLFTLRVRQSYFKYEHNLVFSIGFSWIVSKIILAIGFFLEDAVRLIGYILSEIGVLSLQEYPFRLFTYDTAVTGLGAALFLYLIYGVAYGKYHYKLRKVKLNNTHWPAGLKGLRIVQISDAHLGSFDKPSGFQKGIEMIKSTKPDLILFTGDLVNNLAKEAEPYINAFKSLKATYGKYAILGNHDYADYIQWDSRENKVKNLARLKEIHAEMGFKLLDNEHVKISYNSSELYIAGVENWGLPPFPQYGNLKEAINGIPTDGATILMSHDPSHWDAEILNHPHHIELTLSGHTHGMQFGIDLPFFNWSPVKFKYPRWGGSYFVGKKHLYVNRGFGFLGFPGRSGIRPEITLFEFN